MNEADLEYLRNINTRPGPSAGRSIDPSKPGPDSEQRSPEPQGVEREALLAAHQSMGNCQHKHHFNAMVMVERALADLAQSSAKPALPQAFRGAAENLLIAIGMGWDIEGCVENLRAALAQPDAEPDAWRYKYKGERGEDPGDWFLADKQEIAALPGEQIDVQPLYTAPPRPDTSAGPPRSRCR